MLKGPNQLTVRWNFRWVWKPEQPCKHNLWHPKCGTKNQNLAQRKQWRVHPKLLDVFDSYLRHILSKGGLRNGVHDSPQTEWGDKMSTCQSVVKGGYSLILNAVPIWMKAMEHAKYYNLIIKVQRRMALRIMSVYRTVASRTTVALARSYPVYKGFSLIHKNKDIQTGLFKMGHLII